MVPCPPFPIYFLYSIHTIYHTIPIISLSRLLSVSLSSRAKLPQGGSFGLFTSVSLGLDQGGSGWYL